MSTRRLAVMALVGIFERSAKPRDILDSLSSDLSRRDRAFLMEMVYGVLRYRDLLDWRLSGFIRKPAGLSPFTINNLRVAVYQLTAMRVPERAAVHEAVDAEKMNGPRAPLVNAVLRSYLRSGPSEEAPFPGDPIHSLSVSMSHPLWLIKRWAGRFGLHEAGLLAESNNTQPPMTLRADGPDQRDELMAVLREKGLSCRETGYSPSGITLETSAPFDELSALLPCPLMVQDEAAQLVSYLLDPGPGDRVLDACASPGGKAIHMASLMKDRGEVLAVEADAKRLARLTDNVCRSGLRSIRVRQGDAMKLGGPGDPLFDRILLDAPCSSLGVIRRNPDVKYRHEEAGLKKFGDKQLGLLSAVSGLLKPGGLLVYSVCSTEPEEGEDVVRGFLHNHDDFSIIDGCFDFLKAFEVREEGLTYYRTYPHRHGMDGFFAAKMTRTK